MSCVVWQEEMSRRAKAPGPEVVAGGNGNSTHKKAIQTEICLSRLPSDKRAHMPWEGAEGLLFQQQDNHTSQV